MMSEWRDPRGPLRTAVEVSESVHGQVTLSCGHVRHFNPIYAYRVGDEHRCFACREADAEETTWTAVDVDGIELGLSGLKAAEEGNDLILRTYEPAGARGAAKVALPQGWAITEEVNLLEEPAGAANLNFTPFQLHSWRITRS
jgi:alpha-mannosidase